MDTATPATPPPEKLGKSLPEICYYVAALREMTSASHLRLFAYAPDG
jgi:hypothetical protein